MWNARTVTAMAISSAENALVMARQNAMNVMEKGDCAVIGVLGRVEKVTAFIALVMDIVTADIVAFFVKAQERVNVFNVEEEVIKTAMTATELVSQNVTIAMAMANCVVRNVKVKVRLKKNVLNVKEVDVNYSNDDRKSIKKYHTARSH